MSQDAELKLPPNNLEAERSVLGCIILDNRFLSDTDIVEGDFFYPAHRLVFRAFERLSDENCKIDYVTLTQELHRMDNATGIDYSYIAGLTNAVPTTGNYRHYAAIVKDLSKARFILRTCAEGCEIVGEGKTETDMALSWIMETLITGTRNVRDFTVSRQLGDVIIELDKKEAEREAGTLAPPLRTGFKLLDNLVTLEGGNIMVVAGLANAGKTAMATGVAVNVALSGLPVLWVSSEMSHQEMTARFIGNTVDDISAKNIRRGLQGYLGADPRIPQTLKTNLHQVYLPGGNEYEIGRILQQAVSRYPIRLMVVDYIQRLTYSKSRGNEAQDMGKISGYLKRIAGEYGIPFIVLSQLSNPTYDRKTGETREPELYDLKWSGDIANDADVVVFVHQVGGEDGDSVYFYKWLIRKNKHDSRGMVKAKFVPSKVKFEECDWN